MNPTCSNSFTIIFLFIISLLSVSSQFRQDYLDPCDRNLKFKINKKEIEHLRLFHKKKLRKYYDGISELYCTGDLLKEAQLLKLYPDSKTFVDKTIKEGFKPGDVLTAYEDEKKEKNFTKETLEEFIDSYFDKGVGQGFREWTPNDWVESPEQFKKILDPQLYNWALKLNFLWFKLGRNISEEVENQNERFSLLYVPNGVIVPGGRFREFYYWDSYWIQIGLLHSSMYDTVKGMIENFIYMIQIYGFIPNGGRVYFQRSQPPLLIPMVYNYINHVKEHDQEGVMEYLEQILPYLNIEFNFWLTKRTVNVTDSNNIVHQLAIYNSRRNAPRPESFREDFELGEKVDDLEERNKLYTNLHSGAESGWDFSSRWWNPPPSIKNGNLSRTDTTNIVPVDLNAFLYMNAKIMSEFYLMVGDKTGSDVYKAHRLRIKDTIMSLLWDEESGSWFDYDIKGKRLRKDFYLSNIVPLWCGVDDDKIDKVVNYLEKSKVLLYPAGIPTSLFNTGEQWDFPNGWAPLQHMFVEALEKSSSARAKQIAFETAEKWIIGNYKAFTQTEELMFEKYDVTHQGLIGGGGEYEVVEGFGWTNGVVLDFLIRYGDRLKVPVDGDKNGGSKISSLNVNIAIITSLLSFGLFYW